MAKKPLIWKDGEAPLTRFERLKLGGWVTIGVVAWVCLMVRLCSPTPA